MVETLKGVGLVKGNYVTLEGTNTGILECVSSGKNGLLQSRLPLLLLHSAGSLSVSLSCCDRAKGA